MRLEELNLDDIDRVSDLIINQDNGQARPMNQI